MTLTVRQRPAALLALKERQRRGKKLKRIDNSSLPAGSPMHYYCRLCTLLAETLPEEHSHRPAQFCKECQPLIDAGYSLKNHKFAKFETVPCGECRGSGLGVYDYYLKRRRQCHVCGGTRTIKREKI